MEGGARAMAKQLMEQMARVHGPEFSRQFMEGLTAHSGMMKGGAAPRTVNTPGGNEVVHARMSSRRGVPGGENVPPGGIAPMAYGSPPQAPESFRRNTVGMGRPAGAGHAEEDMPVSGGGRAARGRQIAAIMREKGMSLAEASRYLKSNK